VAIEITTFYRLTKAYHQSLALVATPVSLFLGRFLASPHFGSISESVVVVGDSANRIRGLSHCEAGEHLARDLETRTSPNETEVARKLRLQP
jgi:hypothetical protein